MNPKLLTQSELAAIESRDQNVLFMHKQPVIDRRALLQHIAALTATEKRLTYLAEELDNEIVIVGEDL